MSEEFIMRPTEDVVRHLGLERSAEFEAGRMAMALECITVVRAIEGNPLLRSDVSAAVVSVLETLLVDQGLTNAYEVYDALSRARRPTFVPVPSLVGNADADDAPSPDQASLSDGSSSPDEVPGQMQLPVDKLRALAEAHRSQTMDDDATDSPSELIVEEPEETSTE